MKKLPIGIQVFRKIRDKQQNYIYVDKTREIYNLLNGSEYIFLSRPRRFGKTLFVDTLAEVFMGNKELFEDLYIYDKWDWTVKYPVIRIDFMNGNFLSKKTIEKRIQQIIFENAKRYKIDTEGFDLLDVGILLEQLIRRIHKQYEQKLVVLVDNYDKPILDNLYIHNKQMAMNAKDLLDAFYPTLKACEKYLRFVFLTGVKGYTASNLFSGFDNIIDISINPKYGNITGYTQAELEENFAEYLSDVDLPKLKRWYNGYNYFGDSVYNPFNVLLFLSEGKIYKNYWWQTGNPSFLIEKIKQGDFYVPDIENIEVGEETLNSFDVDRVDPIALLWQTGYLTFDKKFTLLNITSYIMKVPNLEIQISLNALFLNYLTNLNGKATSKRINIVKTLMKKDFNAFKNELNILFANIPYTNYVNNTISSYEGYYASVVYTLIAALGYEVRAEDVTNTGRIDMTVLADDATLIFEFKVDMPSEKALQQIETKQYYTKYLNRELPIYLIGIQFDSSEKAVKNIEWKLLDKFQMKVS